MSLPTILQRLFSARDKTPYHVYGAIVAQARQPVFYGSYAVADTLDGRFDMIVLHAYLLFARLNRNAAESEFAQGVFNIMFADLDRSLREMGVGDLSVPKRIKTMAEAFYGRVHAYEEAAARDGEAALAGAVARNIFPDEETPPGAAAALARYMRAAASGLAGQPFDAIRRDGPVFPDPARFIEGVANG